MSVTEPTPVEESWTPATESNVGHEQEPLLDIEDDPADDAERPFGTHERWYEQGYVG